MSDPRRVELWDAATSAAVDRHTIEVLGVPSSLLMERAALACAHEVVALRRGSAIAVRVVCGPGNNGADGLAIARQLHGWGVPVSVVAATTKGNDASAFERRLASACGVAERSWDDAERSGAAIVVDALLGTGSRGAPRGEVAAALAAMRSWAGPRLAVDLPSGIDPDTGAVYDDAITAQVTVTFGRSKPGLHVTPARARAGRVVVADIGLIAPPSVRMAAALVDPETVRALVRPRPDARHKGERGHVGIEGGGAGTPGAAVLATLAAFRGGAGLLSVATADPTLRAAVLARVPEAMFLSPDAASTVDAWVIGPGLTEPAAQARVAPRWRGDPTPAIWDAGGLDAIDGDCGGRPRIITPHPGEAARLLARLQGDASWSSARVQADRLAAARALAGATGAVVLLKGAGTILAHDDRLAILQTGGPALATAGSGDVLAGILGALLARGVEPWAAACAGAAVHAAAGEVAIRRHPATLASDLVEALDAVDDALAEDALPQLRLA